MGFFDLDFSDPRTMAMLGMMQGYGASTAPSRLPVTKGMVFADALAGLTGGARAGMENRLQGQQAEAARLGNINNLYSTNARLGSLFGPDAQVSEDDLWGRKGDGNSAGGGVAGGGFADWIKSKLGIGDDTVSRGTSEQPPRYAPPPLSMAPKDVTSDLATRLTGSDPALAATRIAAAGALPPLGGNSGQPQPSQPAPAPAPAPGPGPMAVAPPQAGAPPPQQAAAPATMPPPAAPAGPRPPLGMLTSQQLANMQRPTPGFNLPNGMTQADFFRLQVMYGPDLANKIVEKYNPGPTEGEREDQYIARLAPGSPERARAIARAAHAAGAPAGYLIGANGGFDLDPGYRRGESNLASDKKGIEVGGNLAQKAGELSMDMGEDTPPSVRAFARDWRGGAGGGAPIAAPTQADLNDRAFGPGAGQKGPGWTQPLPTDHNSTIPALSEADKLPDNVKRRQDILGESDKTARGWQQAMPALDEERERLVTMAHALQATQSGHWAEQSADMAAALKRIGINLAPEVLGNPAEVEKVIHENAVKTLQQLKAAMQGTGGRFTQMEFRTLSQQTEHPNLQPEANFQQLSEDIGVIDRNRALLRDWSQAKGAYPWRDANDFMGKWYGHNALGQYVDAAGKEIGPLKGMPGFGAGKQKPDPWGILSPEERGAK